MSNHTHAPADPARLIDYSKSVEFLRSRVPAHLTPSVGIVCGSGLGGLVNLLQEKVEVLYSEIPNFVVSTVAGHAGKLVFGLLGNKPCVCMVGRFHPYEGWTMIQVTLPIRVMILMGIKTLLVTNAAGALNPKLSVGSIMVFEDHIALPLISGNNPLIGPNNDAFGPRFPSVSDAYDLHLRRLAFRCAHKLNLFDRVQSGIYCFVSGPQYESRAESRLLRLAGGDAVGMSTVPEVIVARHMGVNVLGLSLITNIVVNRREDDVKVEVEREIKGELVNNQDGMNEDKANHEEVLKASNTYAENVRNLVNMIVQQLE